MIQTRTATFETNSSSTHALALGLDATLTKEQENEILQREYVITPYIGQEYELELHTIEEKLKYLWTVYLQCWYDEDESFTRNDFMKLVQKVVPNAVYARQFTDASKYVFEDAEWLYSDWKHKNWGEEELRDWLLYGTLYFGNRDNEDYYYFLEHELQGKTYLKWSG